MCRGHTPWHETLTLDLRKKEWLMFLNWLPFQLNLTIFDDLKTFGKIPDKEGYIVNTYCGNFFHANKDIGVQMERLESRDFLFKTEVMYGNFKINHILPNNRDSTTVPSYLQPQTNRPITVQHFDDVIRFLNCHNGILHPWKPPYGFQIIISSFVIWNTYLRTNLLLYK